MAKYFLTKHSEALLGFLDSSSPTTLPTGLVDDLNGITEEWESTTGYGYKDSNIMSALVAIEFENEADQIMFVLQHGDKHGLKSKR